METSATAGPFGPLQRERRKEEIEFSLPNFFSLVFDRLREVGLDFADELQAVFEEYRISDNTEIRRNTLPLFFQRLEAAIRENDLVVIFREHFQTLADRFRTMRTQVRYEKAINRIFEATGDESSPFEVLETLITDIEEVFDDIDPKLVETIDAVRDRTIHQAAQAIEAKRAFYRSGPFRRLRRVAAGLGGKINTEQMRVAQDTLVSLTAMDIADSDKEMFTGPTKALAHLTCTLMVVHERLSSLSDLPASDIAALIDFIRQIFETEAFFPTVDEILSMPASSEDELSAFLERIRELRDSHVSYFRVGSSGSSTSSGTAGSTGTTTPAGPAGGPSGGGGSTPGGSGSASTPERMTGVRANQMAYLRESDIPPFQRIFEWVRVTLPTTDNSSTFAIFVRQDALLGPNLTETVMEASHSLFSLDVGKLFGLIDCLDFLTHRVPFGKASKFIPIFGKSTSLIPWKSLAKLTEVGGEDVVGGFVVSAIFYYTLARLSQRMGIPPSFGTPYTPFPQVWEPQNVKRNWSGENLLSTDWTSVSPEQIVVASTIVRLAQYLSRILPEEARIRNALGEPLVATHDVPSWTGRCSLLTPDGEQIYLYDPATGNRTPVTTNVRYYHNHRSPGGNIYKIFSVLESPFRARGFLGFAVGFLQYLKIPSILIREVLFVNFFGKLTQEIQCMGENVMRVKVVEQGGFHNKETTPVKKHWLQYAVKDLGLGWFGPEIGSILIASLAANQVLPLIIDAAPGTESYRPRQIIKAFFAALPWFIGLPPWITINIIFKKLTGHSIFDQQEITETAQETVLSGRNRTYYLEQGQLPPNSAPMGTTSDIVATIENAGHSVDTSVSRVFATIHPNEGDNTLRQFFWYDVNTGDCVACVRSAADASALDSTGRSTNEFCRIVVDPNLWDSLNAYIEGTP